jgi:hypothetical protein
LLQFPQANSKTSKTNKNLNSRGEIMMKNSKKFLNILYGVFGGSLLVLNLVFFYFVNMYWVMMIISTGVVALLAFVTASHYRNLNKINGGGDKDFGYYFKKMWITFILMVLMSVAISEAVGLFVHAIFGGIRINMANSGSNSFLQGAIVKVPLFALYLAIIYNMFLKQGHRDADRKVFNLHLKIVTVALVLLFLMPGAVYRSMYYTQDVPQIGGINIHSVFSANIDVYAIDPNTDYWIENPDFNIVLTGFTVLLAFAVQMGVAVFAFKRGKNIFVKNRLNPGEYETDEKC